MRYKLYVSFAFGQKPISVSCSRRFISMAIAFLWFAKKGYDPYLALDDRISDDDESEE